MNIETKIRNIRFIGELCKFKIAPAGLIFSCLKVKSILWNTFRASSGADSSFFLSGMFR